MENKEFLNFNIEMLKEQNKKLLRELLVINSNMNWFLRKGKIPSQFVDSYEGAIKEFEKLNNQLRNNYKVIKEYKEYKKMEEEVK